MRIGGNEIIEELTEHLRKSGGEPGEWRVGTAKDATLIGKLQTREARGSLPGIQRLAYREALTPYAAADAVDYLVNAFGLRLDRSSASEAEGGSGCPALPSRPKAVRGCPALPSRSKAVRACPALPSRSKAVRGCPALPSRPKAVPGCLALPSRPKALRPYDWPKAVRAHVTPRPRPAKSFSSTARHHPVPPRPAAIKLRAQNGGVGVEWGSNRWGSRPGWPCHFPPVTLPHIGYRQRRARR